MKCIKFTEQLDDFVDGYLAQNDRPAMEQHLTNCPECQKLWQAENDLRQNLKSQPTPEIDLPSLQRMMRMAHREHKNKSRYRFISYGLAAAAGLVLLMTTGLFHGRLENINPQSNHGLMTISQVSEVSKTINLVINCPTNMEQAELTIILPDNIELAAFPGRHELTWKTNLKTGGNLLPLEIITTQPGTAKITAKIEHNSKSRTQTLNMSI
ncbi:MAG: hypothetical protein KKB30_06335 [Proteobacteria bacterium]|nr:hypothetical protein [Pseudomonadota bacterium]MBU1715137.1 hypothetical protein [Pseudomonadota bacterium]